MKIAHLTTWGCTCGVAETTKHFVEHISHPQMVFANVTPHPLLPDSDLVRRIFSVQIWDGNDDIDQQQLIDYRPDILHIQFSNIFYARRWFAPLLKTLRDNGAKIVCTFHDLCIYSEFPWDLVHISLCYRESMIGHLVGNQRCIPMPIPVRPIRLCSFGLGRNPHEAVRDVLQPSGIEFRWHDYRNWVPIKELIEFISGFDGAVLWYPETDVAGTSSAIRIALAARRPTFCSDTTWFKDINSPLVRRYASLPDLVAGVIQTFADPVTDSASAQAVARLHEAIYASL